MENEWTWSKDVNVGWIYQITNTIWMRILSVDRSPTPYEIVAAIFPSLQEAEACYEGKKLTIKNGVGWPSGE